MPEAPRSIQHLLIVEDEQGKRTINLEAATYSLGRDPSNTIVLHSQQVSRQHAILLRTTMPETERYLFRIVDGNFQGKKSTNGLFVNGERSFSHDLEHGDDLLFGGVIRARYYTADSPESLKFLALGQIDEELAQSAGPSPFDTILVPKEEIKAANEAALVRLASFPELFSHPIVELTVTGGISYLNPAAVAQFPNIRSLGIEHPLIAGVLASVRASDQKYFVREVKIEQRYFEQSIHYFAESELVRSYALDITERKLAEEALRQSQESFQHAFNNAPIGMALLSTTGVWLKVNPALYSIIGYSEAELLSTNFQTITHPNDLENSLKLTNQVLAGEISTYQLEKRYLHKQGHTVWVQMSASLVRDGDQNPLYFIVQFQEITLRKQAAIALKQAHDDLERRVAERTAEFQRANRLLQAEIETRQQAEEEAYFLQNLTQAISEAVDFDTALEVALSKICEVTRWELGEAWLPNHDSSLLRYGLTWHADSDRLAYFEGISQQFTFGPNLGLPGRAWVSKRPEWLSNVLDQPGDVFLRGQAFADSGLKTELSFPIVDGSQVIAILVFFMSERCDENQHMFNFVSTVATHLSTLMARKRAEVALRSSVATNRALFNTIPDWIFRINADNVFVNYKAAKNVPLPLLNEPFLGKSLFEVYPDEVAESLQHCIHQALSTKEVQVIEYQLSKAGDLVYYEARIVISAENEVMAIIRDITERKQAEAEIQKALEREKELNELKSNFVSMTSHEFRTPLATILSSSELLEHYSHKWTVEKQLSHLVRIQDAVKHMTELLNDVLLIGKAEAGRLEFDPAPLALTEFCQTIVEEIQITTSKHIVNLQVHGEEQSAQLDPKLLRQILNNLLSNAVKYSPDGGTVHFDLTYETGLENAEVVFRVRDNGIGIPKSDQAKMFTSFNRASNVGTISGTGLGLAIVKKSVDLHGGDIRLKSDIGKGTTFIVRLPLNLRLINYGFNLLNIQGETTNEQNFDYRR
ncbi:PAS domain S-box protein [Romeria aff. gracilis LEGE 07310]|uniref:histidine kinase n=1 Tax=Vasconcelosia minhoensis LEGE 07310 TaxID=915328 RepID=A0A8J7AI36_9CYAN|nr:PAS domain S-box protein [Romeria gracilis]MBE9079364.1 PAS domain S-box protein [Romeria aff. gracilis LEGE 07310]